MKKKILIVGEEGSANATHHFLVSVDYVKRIAQAGGLPIMPLDPIHPEEYLDIADGLLLCGGCDINRAYYGEIYHSESERRDMEKSRDLLELNLCRMFMENKKPVFGIGRGMQLINIAAGGTLNFEVENAALHYVAQDEEPKKNFITQKTKLTTHKIKIKEDSRLFELLSSEEKVNSCHHQSVKDLGNGLKVSAVAEDGTIEAIEHKNLPCFGVQWHPERCAEGLNYDGRLFEYFVGLCGEARK